MNNGKEMMTWLFGLVKTSIIDFHCTQQVFKCFGFRTRCSSRLLERTHGQTHIPKYIISLSPEMLDSRTSNKRTASIEWSRIKCIL